MAMLLVKKVLLQHRFAASSDRYYATMLYNFDTGLDVVISSVHEESPLLFVKGKSDLKLSGYIGPKNHEVLTSIDPRLTDVIEYGFFTFISRPLFKLLNFLHSMTDNWGWSIVYYDLTYQISTISFDVQRHDIYE